MYSACFAAIELFVAFTHAYSRGTLKLSDRIKKLLGKMTWPRKVITLKTNRKFKDQPDRHRPSEYMFSQAQGDFSNAHMILLQTFIVQQRKCVEDIEELVKEAHTERKNRAKQERNKKKKKEINTSFPDTLQQKVVGLIRKIDWCYTEYFKGCFLYLKLRSFVRAQEVKFDEGDVTKPLSITSIWERGDVVFAAIVDAPEELSPAPFLPLTPGFVESESDDEGSEGPSGGTIASTAGSKVKVTAQQRTSSSKSHRAREASESEDGLAHKSTTQQRTAMSKRRQRPKGNKHQSNSKARTSTPASGSASEDWHESDSDDSPDDMFAPASQSDSKAQGSTAASRRERADDGSESDSEGDSCNARKAYIGRTVWKQFDEGVFQGTVKEVGDDYFFIEYTDGDSETVELSELVTLLDPPAGTSSRDKRKTKANGKKR
jgi:hypothetical protein